MAQPSYGGAIGPGWGTGGNKPRKPKPQKRKRTPAQREARRRVDALLNKKGGKKKGQGGLTVEQRRALFKGIGTTGADPASVWADANKKQRGRIKRSARKRGVTLESFLQGGPRALQERTPAGIRKTARKTVNTAYKSAFAELDDQETKIKNLREKEQQDLSYYTQWQTTKLAEMDAAARAADTALLASQTAERDAMEDYYTQQRANAAAQMAATPGLENIDTSGSTILDNSDEALKAQRDRAAGDASERGAIASGQAVRAGLFSGIQQRASASDLESRQRMVADLSDLGIERKKLRLDRAGAMVKEIARLADLEVTKAQSSKEFNLAAEKLGVEAADKAADNRRENAKLKLTQREFRLERRLAKIEIELKKRDLSNKERNTLLREREIINKELEVGAYADDGGSGGGGKAGNGESREDNRKLWNEVQNIYNTDAAPTQAWRQNPLLREAAAQMYRNEGRGIGPSLAAKIKKRYGIKIKVYRPTLPDGAGGRK
jgi:hypothetical protein